MGDRCKLCLPLPLVQERRSKAREREERGDGRSKAERPRWMLLETKLVICCAKKGN